MFVAAPQRALYWFAGLYSHYYTLIVYSSTVSGVGVVEHCTGTFVLSLDALVLQ